MASSRTHGALPGCRRRTGSANPFDHARHQKQGPVSPGSRVQRQGATRCDEGVLSVRHRPDGRHLPLRREPGSLRQAQLHGDAERERERAAPADGNLGVFRRQCLDASAEHHRSDERIRQGRSWRHFARRARNLHGRDHGGLYVPLPRPAHGRNLSGLSVNHRFHNSGYGLPADREQPGGELDRGGHAAFRSRRPGGDGRQRIRHGERHQRQSADAHACARRHTFAWRAGDAQAHDAGRDAERARHRATESGLRDAERQHHHAIRPERRSRTPDRR